MDRKCSHCKQILPDSGFNWKIKRVKLSYQCKNCSRAYVKAHYQNNHDYYLKKAKRRNKQIKIRMMNFITSFLVEHPCIDCGEKDIVVLEFDHRNPKDKVGEVSRLIRRGLTFKKITQEISKCDVRCANCHRRKTAKDHNFWKSRMRL